MNDGFGRRIDYLRVSITDRCNLRCRYCMPDGIQSVPHSDVLRYEELLRLCRIAAELGVTRFKVTGGEPLVRKDCAEFVGALKAVNGAKQVTLTTNGIFLSRHLEDLRRAGIDAINISLDTLDEACYARLTGGGAVHQVLAAAYSAAAAGIPTKFNAVLLPETLDSIPALVEQADALPADVRLIEQMPLGAAAPLPWVPAAEALARLRQRWPDLSPTAEIRGNGPARYYQSAALRCRIGIIDAVSHGFCRHCNRIRLTAVGELKPCLCSDGGTDLRRLLHSGAADSVLREAMAACIAEKPAAHCFGARHGAIGGRGMNEIGG